MLARSIGGGGGVAQTHLDWRIGCRGTGDRRRRLGLAWASGLCQHRNRLRRQANLLVPYVSERKLDSCIADFPEDARENITITQDGNSVHASVLFGAISAEAIYEEEYGCRIVN